MRSLARLSAGDLDGYSGLIPKLPSALQVDLKVDPEAVQNAEVEEVWGPAGKLEWGRMGGETAPMTPKTRGKRQERGGGGSTSSP